MLYKVGPKSDPCHPLEAIYRTFSFVTLTKKWLSSKKLIASLIIGVTQADHLRI